MADDILVHVATPATRANDALYRALAAAYRRFTPCDSNAPSIPSNDSYGSFPSQLSAEDLPSTTGRLAQLESIHDKWRRQHAPPVAGQREATAFIQDSQAAARAVESQLQHESMPASPAAEDADADADAFDFSKLPRALLPPRPKASMAAPGALPSQVTGHLGQVKTQHADRFRPVKRLRALEADERGFWLVRAGDWPRRAQHEFWLRVSKLVGSGQLGWGVSVHREQHSARELGPVRVYCWGEIAEHTWLAVWLCSQGQAAGSEWVDADGAVVLQLA